MTVTFKQRQDLLLLLLVSCFFFALCRPRDGISSQNEGESGISSSKNNNNGREEAMDEMKCNLSPLCLPVFLSGNWTQTLNTFWYVFPLMPGCTDSAAEKGERDWGGGEK